jgi:hypothetical protein
MEASNGVFIAAGVWTVPEDLLNPPTKLYSPQDTEEHFEDGLKAHGILSEGNAAIREQRQEKRQEIYDRGSEETKLEKGKTYYWPGQRGMMIKGTFEGTVRSGKALMEPQHPMAEFLPGYGDKRPVWINVTRLYYKSGDRYNPIMYGRYASAQRVATRYLTER